MKRKKDITSYFGLKKKNENDEGHIETEPDELGVERAEAQSESTEQERETDEDPESEAEGDIQAGCETPTEDACASTSTGPSGL